MRFDFQAGIFDPPELEPAEGEPRPKWRVFCDGVELRECWFADERAGEARVYELRDGQPFIAEGTDFAAFKVLRGEVKIVRADK